MEEAPVETGPVTGVTGRALLVDLDQDGVPVAVQPDLLDPLPMSRGLPLDPVLLTRPGPERRTPAGQCPVQRLVVHPAQHEHLAGVVLLYDGRDQAVLVSLQPGGDPGIQWGAGKSHGPSIPDGSHRVLPP